MAQGASLMRALGLSHHWQHLLDEGRFSSMTEIAAVEGIDLGQASRISRLAHLAPDLIEGIASDDLRWASANCCAASGRRPGWRSARCW